MKIPSLLVAAFVVCAAPLAIAEIVSIDGTMSVRDAAVDHPARGSTMQSVESRFGAPVSKHAAVGRPPITRWDYPGFSVFFENDRVLHSVANAG
jgi:hypothetical protein